MTTGAEGVLIAVPTIAEDEQLRRVADRVSALKMDALILTSGGDHAVRQGQAGKTIVYYPFTGSDRLRAREQLPSARPSVFCVRESWDLPDKRNFAIRYARERGYGKLLLIDDDICGLSLNDVCFCSDITDIHAISGILSGYFPDDSVTGHISVFCGEEPDVFISGNCLFLNLESRLGHFARIYNEDWLFSLSSDVQSLRTLAKRTVNQRHHTKWLSKDEAIWQEPGEFVTSSVVNAIVADNADTIFELAFWRDSKDSRLGQLSNLGKMIRNLPEIWEVIEGSIDALRQIEPGDALRFMEDFAIDSFRSREGRLY